MAQDTNAEETDPGALTQTRFPCDRCGALLVFAPGSGSLECRYCGHVNVIGDAGTNDPQREYDFHAALAALADAKARRTTVTRVKCPACAGEFSPDAHVHAEQCPFCGTSIVVAAGHLRPIQPRSLLPFSVPAKAAREAFKVWLSGLWFAPSALKRYAREEGRLTGVYLPYWTYDSDTESVFSGMRGDTYYVTQYVTSVENGRAVRRARRVPRIRWTPVSGRVKRHFDDVLVGASRTLPRKIADRLGPWHLEQLEPYDPRYLSGHRSEVYQVELDEGFDLARQIMDQTIRGDVRRHIGGDLQRITHLDTHHRNTTFKHLLLPVWTAAFSFHDKTYRFVVNGRTGKTQGERPYSYAKIAFAVAGALVLAVGLWYLADAVGLLELPRDLDLGGLVDPRGF